MSAFKKQKKYIPILILLFASLPTMLAFQNCGQPLQSQSASSFAGDNTTSSTPDPAPAPAPGPVPTPVPAPVPTPVPAPVPGATPLTQAERQQACAPFLDTSKPASLTVSVTDLSMRSGLANNSGDFGTDIFTQVITTGLKSNPVIPVPAGRTTTPATCNVNTAVSCVVATDSAHLAKIEKAVNMNTGSALYGVDEAVGATQAKMNSIAGNIANRNNTCATALASTALSVTRQTTAMPNIRNTNGYRCAKGYYWIKMGVTTTVESTTSTPAPTAVNDFKYVEITVNDGCWAESRLKTPVELPRLARMGSQIAVTDTWVAAVAPVDNGLQVGEGSVYMFRNSNGVWSYHSKLNIPGAAMNDTISAAAISGNIMVVSSQNRNAKQGYAAVFYFNGTSWNFTHGINPPVARSNQLFGSALALSGSHLVIGAPGFSNNSSGNDLSGIAYVYGCQTSRCDYRYAISNTRKAGAALGSAIAISGNRVVIGAPQAIVITDQGDGYVEIFDISSAASSVGYLAPPAVNKVPADADYPTGMRFGASVDINGVTVAVGAPHYNDNITDRIASGAAYLWTDFASSTVRTLNTSPTGRANNGQSVALSGSSVFVGCPFCNSDLTGAGLVRAYSTSVLPGTLNFTLFALNKASNSGFGYAVKATNSYLAVGSPVKADPNNSGGASYVYRLP